VSAAVIVVGAGVIGASTAFHLTRLGIQDVLVVDQGGAGTGMSSRSSALVRMHYTFGPEVELAVRSDRMFDNWSELVGRPGCITRTGFVRIVHPGEEGRLRHNVAMQRALGARVELVSGTDLVALAPGLRGDDVALAAFEPHGGFGDGAVVAGDFIAAARDAGAHFSPGAAVRELLVEAGSVRGVMTDQGEERAPVVVLATGPWTPALLEPCGISLPIESELHHVAVVHHRRGGGAPLACIDSTTASYFRPDRTGDTTVIGAFRGTRPARPSDAERDPSPESLAELVTAAARRVPALEEGGVGRGVAGVYDMTPDGRPLLGRVEGLDGLVVAVGFSGMGFKISPAVGEAVAELVADGAARAVDLKPFRPSRFDEGAAIEPEWAYSDD
jgi:sarcosine oxidase, subunit beta